MARMTEEQREELINEFFAREPTNISAFSRDFAEKHGLNAQSVRSVLGRVRRQLPREPEESRSVRLLMDSDPVEYAALGAAAVIRYEQDPEFHAAVDAERARIEDLYKLLAALNALPVTTLAEAMRIIEERSAERSSE